MRSPGVWFQLGGEIPGSQASAGGGGVQKQGLERGGSWNPASGRGSHRAEGPLGSCVACRAGLNPRSLCTFKVAKMWARCPSPYRFSRLSEQWPALPPLLFFLTLFSKFQLGVGRDACWMTMQSATYRDGLSQGLEPTQELQVQTEQLRRIVPWRLSSLELGTEKPRGRNARVLSCSSCPPWHCPWCLAHNKG